MRIAKGFVALVPAFVFLFTPSRPAQIVAFVLVCIPLLDMTYLSIVSRSIRVRRRDSIVRGHRGQKFEIEFILENRSIFPLVGIILQDATGTIPCDDLNRLLLSMAPRERRVVRYRITPRERGEYALGPISLRLRDFFGISERKIIVQDYCRVIVFPRVDKIAFGPKRGVPQGDLKSNARIDEDPTRYRSLRDYVSGDELKRINWKASARTGKLVANEYENALTCPLVILLNLSLNEYPLKTRYLMVEEAISDAASLILAASSRGQAVGLVSTGTTIGDDRPILLNPRVGAALPILDTLARIRPSEEASALIFAEECARLPYRAHAAYVGADPGQFAQTLATEVRKRGGQLRFHLTEFSVDSALHFARLGMDAVATMGAIRA